MMKFFKEVEIGETFVVEGGFVLVKVSETEAEFPDAPNVGRIPHEALTKTFSEEEFSSLPIEDVQSTFEV